MTKKLDCKLPAKPSELILLALADLVATEKMKKTYAIDMGTWHNPNDFDNSGKCAVCFAGAVMAQTCKIPPTKGAAPFLFSKADRIRLEALDYFREGNVTNALLRMAVKIPDFVTFDDILITPYEDDPKAFKTDMNILAADLAGMGL